MAMLNNQRVNQYSGLPPFISHGENPIPRCVSAFFAVPPYPSEDYAPEAQL